MTGKQGFITVCLVREAANQPWGFRLQGGKDRGLPFQLLKVPLDSIASHSGCKSGDYLVKINGENVFNLGHEEAKDLIRRAGNKLDLVVERGEMIVPSMNTAFPKPKTEDEADNKPKSYSQMVSHPRQVKCTVVIVMRMITTRQNKQSQASGGQQN